MRRAALAIAILLILLIVFSALAVFLLDRSSRSSQSITNQPQANQVQENTVNDANTNLNANVILKAVSKNGDLISADVSFDKNGQKIDRKVDLFDPKLNPTYYIVTYPNADGIGETSVKPLKDSGSIYDELKKLEGKGVQLTFELENKNVQLACNRILVDFLSGKIDQLTCTPFSSHLSVYGK